MKIVNIYEAKAHLSRLVEKACAGEPFIIAKAGRPIVKVVALDAPDSGEKQRLGFMAGQIEIPEDFDQFGVESIDELFNGVERPE